MVHGRNALMTAPPQHKSQGVKSWGWHRCIHSNIGDRLTKNVASTSVKLDVIFSCSRELTWKIEEWKLVFGEERSPKVHCIFRPQFLPKTDRPKSWIFKTWTVISFALTALHNDNNANWVSNSLFFGQKLWNFGKTLSQLQWSFERKLPKKKILKK